MKIDFPHQLWKLVPYHHHDHETSLQVFLHGKSCGRFGFFMNILNEERREFVDFQILQHGNVQDALMLSDRKYLLATSRGLHCITLD